MRLAINFQGEGENKKVPQDAPFLTLQLFKIDFFEPTKIHSVSLRFFMLTEIGRPVKQPTEGLYFAFKCFYLWLLILGDFI